MDFPILASAGPKTSRWTGPGALVLLLSGCGEAPVQTGRAETLIRLSDDDIKSTDPQAASDLATMRVAADQFEGLTRLDRFARVEGGLARRWQVSADGLEWTFWLHPDLRFSDGHPITAATIAHSLTRLRAAETASPLSELAAPLSGWRVISPTTLVISVSQPVPHLPELLAHPAFAALPLHRANWMAERPMTASGAFRLNSWSLSDRILLERNPAWHGGTAALAQVVWKPVTDSLSGMRMVLAGEADIAAEFPSSRLPDLRARHVPLVRIAAYRGTYYFSFNTRKPPFNDPRVRQALSLAVNRDWLANTLIASGVKPAHRLIPPPLAARCGQDQSDHPRPDLNQARQLLAQAGYGPQRPLRFTIRFNSDTDHRRTAVALAAMWKPLAVEAQLLNTEAALHFASMRRGDFELARSGWIGDFSAPENFLAVHRSGAGAVNYSGYSSPAFDAALSEAERIADPQRRACAMARAEAVLLADAPILPLWYYVSKSLVGPRVTGWTDNLANAHPSRTLGVK